MVSQRRGAQFGLVAGFAVLITMLTVLYQNSWAGTGGINPLGDQASNEAAVNQVEQVRLASLLK